MMTKHNTQGMIPRHKIRRIGVCDEESDLHACNVDVNFYRKTAKRSSCTSFLMLRFCGFSCDRSLLAFHSISCDDVDCF